MVEDEIPIEESGVFEPANDDYKEPEAEEPVIYKSSSRLKPSSRSKRRKTIEEDEDDDNNDEEGVFAEHTDEDEKLPQPQPRMKSKRKSTITSEVQEPPASESAPPPAPSPPKKRGRGRPPKPTAAPKVNKTASAFEEDPDTTETDVALHPVDPNTFPSATPQKVSQTSKGPGNDTPPATPPDQKADGENGGAGGAGVGLGKENERAKAASHSPLSKGKVPYRVGLSRRARIAPLLRVVKK
ncbi:hypothetical protein LTS18_006508 [Coniosporium uncinatum]|uniref:Uncharacterized protein n=1 Tax=Coniosporium uncinatum TaxID=93489 RepID=A0ACC3DXM0_9PEZI|nr:hypothetical protein LTS18_006508 [Coniosporium uncinatum]